MTKVKDFLHTHRYAIIWTLCYVLCVWAILYFLFGFDLLSRIDWWRLAHAHLRGFGAFVFGILLLAAVPLYVATTAVIVRTKKPLITVPMPKFIHPAATEPQDDVAPVETPTPKNTFPEDLPTELYEPFLRARAHVSQNVLSGINNIDLTLFATPETPATPNDTDLPLPPDFDSDVEDDVLASLPDVPVFSEIDFDSEPSDK